jgi:DNA repair ATPase RecN
MEDKLNKIYDLIEKTYIELQDTKKELSDTKTELKSEIKDVGRRLTKVEIILENDIKPKIDTLFETQAQILEKLGEHDKRFDILESKIDSHDVEIRVLRGVK